MDTPQQPAADTVELVLDAKATLAEGSLWHPIDQVLYWVDIEGQSFHIYDPATDDNRTFPTGSKTGTVVPVRGGGALLALQKGIHKIDTGTGEMTLIADPIEADDIRFNDGKCDPAGRFWVGTMALDAREGAAVLYRMDLDGKIEQVLENVTISNGIVWTEDRRTMYYVDTPTRRIQAFDYDDASGEISNGRVIVEIPEGSGKPDGMTIDGEGKLWVALFGGNAVARFDPDTGEMLRKIEVPAPNVTSCAFGGENLDVLYITTGREGLSDEKLEKYPGSGGIFAIKPGVKGVPAYFYKGNL